MCSWETLMRVTPPAKYVLGKRRHDKDDYSNDNSRKCLPVGDQTTTCTNISPVEEVKDCNDDKKVSLDIASGINYTIVDTGGFYQHWVIHLGNLGMGEVGPVAKS
ncbi:hypothetical protein BC937DRAFT_87974 [Endogone sp. FLAS-F59071]|nr:hypothetical protein BC937DRAFT_87974 [Endogone sp. FLAS-F59071]|eukprot:RUS10980.1 hypothetical protein BC937DRAFT_87974 [Endogone sp. FLAS-F59071]